MPSEKVKSSEHCNNVVSVLSCWQHWLLMWLRVIILDIRRISIHTVPLESYAV